MGDSDKFEIQGSVKGFPAKKKGAKGIYWNIDTTAGKINVKQDDEPQFEENVMYRFSGHVSSFEKDGETIKMKWCTEWGKTGETTTMKEPSKKEPHNEPLNNQLNGPAMGARMNNVTLIVCAQINKSDVLGDNDSILKAMKYWNEIIKRYQETGILDEIPF